MQVRKMINATLKMDQREPTGNGSLWFRKLLREVTACGPRQQMMSPKFELGGIPEMCQRRRSPFLLLLHLLLLHTFVPIL